MLPLQSPELLDCGHPESPHSEHTRGYGTTPDGKRHCYDCCAETDRQQMRKDGKITLYLTNLRDYEHNPKVGLARVTNWPASLSLSARYKKGRHNIARTRYDVWFRFEKTNWHGVQYGENTQILHCKRLKH